MGGKTSPIWNQESFEFYDDSGGEGVGGQGVNNDWTVPLDTPYRIRFLVQETAGATTATTPSFWPGASARLRVLL